MRGKTNEHRSMTPTFEGAVSRVLDLTRERLKESFINRPYHNLLHAEHVDARSNLLLRIMQPGYKGQISLRDISLAHIAALGHDVIQPDQTAERRGQSPERASADWVLNIMREQNSNLGSEVFDSQDMQIVEEAIMATTVEINGSIIRQPLLKNATSPVTIAVALADLNASGIEGPAALLSDSRTLFGELFLSKNPAQPTEALVNWIKEQVAFVVDRKAQLPVDLAAISTDVLPVAAAVNILAHCNPRFDASRQVMQTLADQVEGKNLGEIMQLLQETEQTAASF